MKNDDIVEVEESPVSYPSISPDTSKWELDISEIVRNIEQNFGGYRYEFDKEGRLCIKKDENLAVLNEKGLRYLITKIITIAHQGTALSELSEDMIRKFVLFKIDAVRMEMRAKHKEFGIKRHHFESMILDLAFLMYAWLMRAHKGGERAYRRGIERRIIERKEGRKGFVEAVTSLFREGKE